MSVWQQLTTGLHGPSITAQTRVCTTEVARQGLPPLIANRSQASAGAHGGFLRRCRGAQQQIPRAASPSSGAPQPMSQPSGTESLRRGTSLASWGNAATPEGDRNGFALAASALAEPPSVAAPGSDADRLAGESLVTRIFTPEELEEHLTRQSAGLTVLMCKAHSCRPCKMFSRKFARLAEAYPEVSFLEIFGDDDKATRGMMVKMGIKVTPTFRLYRNSECVHKLSGINETNLRNAVEEH